jgi:prepilin-type N-terminal cleavage/methylation domain-containing protein
MNYSGQKAFTLVEILVVIAVIGLLSSVIFAITRGADEQGRIARGLYFSQHLHNSLGSYAAGIWSFDEGSGSTANDISGWNNNGSLVNSPTWRCASTDTSYTPSAQGCSLEFNGSSNYVSISDDIFGMDGDFTVELWLKPITSPGSYKRFFTLIDETNNLQLTINNGQLSWRFDNVANRTTEIISIGNWSHFVFIRDTVSGSNSMYINGIKTNDTVTGPTANGNYSAIGGGYSDSYMFNGLIDEVRIYSTALTATQIRDQYYAGLERLLAKGQITEQEYQQRLVKT